MVTAIVQDHFGFMWYGTANGLNQYDGTRFEVFKPAADSSIISNNSIISLLSDSKKTSWAGTCFGLNRFDYATRKFKRIFPGKPGDAEDNKIKCIAEGKKGNLWAGTRRGGLNVLPKVEINSSGCCLQVIVPKRLIRK